MTSQPEPDQHLTEQTTASAPEADAVPAVRAEAEADPAPASPWAELAGRELATGHGTGNDFVLLTDPDATLELAEELVARVCDRHLGIGADGLIRAVRSEHLPEGRALLAERPDAEWFMDYRNADGSLSEMCGNGVRVFAHYLIATGLVDTGHEGPLAIATRAGVRAVARTAEGYAVDMGPWGFLHGDEARDSGSDAMVSARGLRTPRPGLSLSMGNPHTVVALADEAKLAGLDLHQPPAVRPTPPDGTNVEFVVPVDAAAEEPGTGAGEATAAQPVGRIALRVHERGSGETLSCGTGACAAAAATRFWGGEDAPDEWIVEVPGGTLGATFVIGPDELEHVVLSGPAELVASVRLL